MKRETSVKTGDIYLEHKHVIKDDRRMRNRRKIKDINENGGCRTKEKKINNRKEIMPGKLSISNSGKDTERCFRVIIRQKSRGTMKNKIGYRTVLEQRGRKKVKIMNEKTEKVGK